MERVTVDLPADLGDYVQERVADGGWESNEDYFRALIEEDRERGAELIRLLQDGVDSGMSPLSFDEIIATARERCRAKT